MACIDRCSEILQFCLRLCLSLQEIPRSSSRETRWIDTHQIKVSNMLVLVWKVSHALCSANQQVVILTSWYLMHYHCCLVLSIECWDMYCVDLHDMRYYCSLTAKPSCRGLDLLLHLVCVLSIQHWIAKAMASWWLVFYTVCLNLL